MKSEKLRPAIFLRAAERIVLRKDHFACNAINHVVGEHYSPEVEFFADIFQQCGHIAWYGVAGYSIGDFSEEQARNRDARAFGLILCSILAKEGFTP